MPRTALRGKMRTDSSPYVLIAIPDPALSRQVAELVSARNGTFELVRVSEAGEALARCAEAVPLLLIASGELDAVDLLRRLRQDERTRPLPVVVVDGRVDAETVRAVLPLAPSAYLAPPFDVAKLSPRLFRLLPDPADDQQPVETLPDVDRFLVEARSDSAGAPLMSSVGEILTLRLDAAHRDLNGLAHRFARDPQVTARLIAEANAMGGLRGRPVNGLAQALTRLGVEHALNRVLDMALRKSVELKHPLLVAAGQRLGESARQTAELAGWLAAELDLDSERCYTAGLLHNLGDLAVLRALQQWVDRGGELTEERLAHALREHASPFGWTLRTRWRLPITLRELVTAYYQLGHGVFAREALVLSLTGHLQHHLAAGDDDLARRLAEERAARLLRLPEGLLERWLGLLQRR